MYLYHYSAHMHQVLLSKAASGAMTHIQIKLARQEARRKGYEAWPYCDHISFFFDPIPASLLPTLFGDNHPFWYKGHKLYEHVIKVADLPGDIMYHVVESKNKTALLDKFAEENNWVEDNPELLLQWEMLISQKEREWRERGTRRDGLINQIKLNEGGTAEAYIQASKRDDFEWGKNKYAANVPHLMLYPPKGEIKVHEIRSLTMGWENRRNLVNTSVLR